MNWEKIKNFLIILFLGINIFLVFIMLNSVKTTSSTSKSVVRDTVSILQANNINISEDIIPLSIDNPGSFDATPININHSYDSPKNITESNIESEIKKALAVINIKNYKIVATDNLSYLITQKVDGYTVFDSGITARAEGNRIILSGVWYNQKTKPKINSFADDGLVSVTGVLIDFINNADRNPLTHNSITKIDVGYCVPLYDSGTQHVSVPAVPCYSITTSDGTFFLYEAASGVYLKNK